MPAPRSPAMRMVAATALFWGTALCLALCGCYNGQEMVDRVAQRVADDHLQEVELGEYQVSLPRYEGEAVITTVRLEVVAAVERKHAREVKRELAEVGTRLRHATLITLRQTRRTELLEPDLASLHERIRSTTEEYVTSAPIERIAFRSFAVYED